MKSGKLLYILSLLWALCILLLGGWWLYLIYQLGEGEPTHVLNYQSLIKWEGGSFIALLFALSASLSILYVRDIRKAKAMQAFFGSLTHELKTPLASIRLQSDVIDEMVGNLPEEQKIKLKKLSGRMIEDTLKLETQMDKILQLSRIERGGNLNPIEIDLVAFLNKQISNWDGQALISLEVEPGTQAVAFADEMALELVFKNLIENTLKHGKNKTAKVKIKNNGEYLSITYDDEGEFKGDEKKLGTLFYKHNSSKGSGIGLYLSRQLIAKMKGDFSIHVLPHFQIHMNLLKGEV